MIELEGEFLEHPTPNKLGCWVYRKLPDDTLLETELSHPEWHALCEKWRQARLAAIRDLNTHPLNQAAKALLDCKGGHNPSSMALLELAFHALTEEGRNDSDDTMQTLAQWMGDPRHCRRALAILEGSHEITESRFVGQSATEAGRLILEWLELR